MVLSEHLLMSELDDDEFEPLATKRPRPVEVSWNRNLNDDPTDDTEHPSEADEETDDDVQQGCVHNELTKIGHRGLPDLL